MASGDADRLHCVQSNAALMFASMVARGSRSPCPEWWVTEANRRLAHRGLTKKQLAKAFASKGLQVSEMMVLRCLHDDPRRRVPTIEAIAHISDALGIPRPVVVAASIDQARELNAVVAFSELDAKALAIAADVSDDRSNGVTDEGSDTAQRRNTRNAAPVDGRGPRAPKTRPEAVRRAPRSR